MPTPSGEALSSTIPPSFPSAVETHIIPTHQAQLQQNILAQHRRARSQGDVELQELGPSSPVFIRHQPESSRRSQLKKLAPLQIPSSTKTPESSHLLCSSPSESDSEDNTEEQMGKSARKSRSPNPNSLARTNPLSRTSSTDSRRSLNGHANGTMNGLVEQRRKHASIDTPTSANQAAHLMNRHSFTLDDPVPTMTHDPEASPKGFMDLPEQDRRNFLLLVLLYFLQGIPMGLATGSVPFLLKSHVSYAEIGVFSLASYPYSLKLLWSPIVDAIWSPKVGRRKSWILPIQTVSGFSMLWLGSRVQQMMVNAEAKDGGGVWNFTWWWFALVFLCATQDIAVDGEQIIFLGISPCVLVYNLANISYRLGPYTPFSRESILCLYSTNSRIDGRPILVLYRISRIQLEGFLQQMVPTYQRTPGCGYIDLGRLSQVLGMGVSDCHTRPGCSQTRRED